MFNKGRNSSVFFDFDNTIFDPVVPFYTILEQTLGKVIDPSRYGIDHLSEESKQFSVDLFKSKWYMIDTILPHEGALDLIHRLLYNEIDVEIVTARADPYILELTINLIDNLFDCNVPCVSILSENRVRYLKSKNATIYVDDNWDVCKEYAKHGKRVFCMSCVPWFNKEDYDIIHSKWDIQSVKDMNEVDQYLFT